MSIATLFPKQEESLRESTTRVTVWDGSVRSGKTVASALRWLLFIAAAPERGALVMVGRTRDSVWRNVIAEVLMNPEIVGPYAHSVVGSYGAPTVTILGRRVYVMGAHDSQSEKVLRGLTVCGAYVDEATVLQEHFFAQLLLRMSVPGAKLFATTNPDGPRHWLKVKYLDKIKTGALDGWKHFHFVLDDNTSLTESYKNAIKAENVGLFYKRFILGQWVAAEGAVFDAWDEDVHVLPAEQMPPIAWWLATGLDYGTTNATAALALGVTTDGRLALTDEWSYVAGDRDARLTDAALSDGLRTWLTTLPEQPAYTIIDPAAASLKVQLRNDGVRNLMNGDNSVLYGLRLMSALIASGKLVVSESCTLFREEVPAYVWDPKATEKGEDKPLKVGDHAIDAARYAITTTESKWRRYVTLTTPIEEKEAA